MLLGSASTPSAVRVYLRGLFPLAPATPPALFSAFSRFGVSAAPFFGARTWRDTRTFAAMGKDADAHFMSWAVRAIASWQPQPLAAATTVHRLHGARDLLIAPPAAGPRTTILSDAGHLPTLTHVDDVNAFLRGVLDRS